MYTYNAIIKRIIDGDTIEVDIDLGFNVWLSNVKVRLYGINAPETRTKNLEEKKLGNLSKKFIKQYCPLKSKITIETFIKKSNEKYGRILGIIKIENNEKSLNQLLLDNKLAVPYMDE
jgi:micrococcal nuclease